MLSQGRDWYLSKVPWERWELVVLNFNTRRHISFRHCDIRASSKSGHVTELWRYSRRHVWRPGLDFWYFVLARPDFIANHFTCQANGCDLGAFWFRWPAPRKHQVTWGNGVFGNNCLLWFRRGRGLMVLSSSCNELRFYLLWSNLTPKARSHVTEVNFLSSPSEVKT